MIQVLECGGVHEGMLIHGNELHQHIKQGNGCGQYEYLETIYDHHSEHNIGYIQLGMFEVIQVQIK
jgi:hypothetical protein